MTCQTITTSNAVITLCGLPDYQEYWCFESVTYLFEYHRYFGPAWFRMPKEEQVFPEPGGTMDFLWQMFDQWVERRAHGVHNCAKNTDG